MKVEKCPRCGQVACYGTEDDMWYVECPRCCDYEAYVKALTRNGAIRKWNRWARREAKRIGKEGKGEMKYKKKPVVIDVRRNLNSHTNM